MRTASRMTIRKNPKGGWPLWSSSRPGASPTSIIRAGAGPLRLRLPGIAGAGALLVLAAILTLAAVSVEVVILIVLLQGAPNPTLARDTVFSAVMFDINGILGLAAIVGGLKHGQTKYNISSANSYISMLLVAIGIGMFIPDFVPDSQWHFYSIFSVCTMALMYAGFLRLQTVEHAVCSFGIFSTRTMHTRHEPSTPRAGW